LKNKEKIIPSFSTWIYRRLLHFVRDAPQAPKELYDSELEFIMGILLACLLIPIFSMFVTYLGATLFYKVATFFVGLYLLVGELIAVILIIHGYWRIHYEN